MPRSLPLAWLQLARDKVRLVVAVVGVTFAVVLMLMQLGFRSALYNSAVRLHSHLDGELFLISPQSAYLVTMKSFSRRRLYQALAVPGVSSASSVYVMLPLWKNPETGSTRSIFVVGFDPDRFVLNLPEVKRNAENLKAPDTVLFDSASRPEFGPIADKVAAGKTVTAEVNNRKITVIGLFELGTSFGIDGTLITSDLNFRRIQNRDEGAIDIGVLKLEPGADVERIHRRLASILPSDVQVLDKRQFMDREIDYWATVTPIGFVFAFGAIMGFIVGTIIVYQVLFADVADHFSEYATLKAIGYADAFISAVVLFEAVILSLAGFVPGVLISRYLYRITENATHLPMRMTPQMGLIVLVLTVIMCGISGLIAVRKVRTADPADIF
jgi:putative ABC transport system permease protein